MKNKDRICKHEFEVSKIEDVPGEDYFYKTKDGSLSKRWKTSKCKKCGQIASDPIL